MSCRKCTTKIYLQTFNNGLICANKAEERQLPCSSLLFCFRELNRFLKISVRDPRKILRVSRNSILKTFFSNLENRNSSLETRFSILKNFEDRESSFESRLSTYIWAVLYSNKIKIQQKRWQDFSVSFLPLTSSLTCVLFSSTCWWGHRTKMRMCHLKRVSSG